MLLIKNCILIGTMPSFPETSRGQSTRTRMVRAAMDLFHRKGIHATSVDQVLEASNTGKSQFAYYFKTKDGLIHAVLQQYYSGLKSNHAPHKTKIESWADLEEWFERSIRFQEATKCERSCPVGTIGGDLSSEQELLRQDARLLFDLMNRSLVDFFNTQKGKGRLRKGYDPQSLADLCFCIMQGGLLVGKIRRESQPLKNAVAHAIQYLKLAAAKPPSRKRNRTLEKPGNRK